MRGRCIWSPGPALARQRRPAAAPLLQGCDGRPAAGCGDGDVAAPVGESHPPPPHGSVLRLRAAGTGRRSCSASPGLLSSAWLGLCGPEHVLHRRVRVRAGCEPGPEATRVIAGPGRHVHARSAQQRRGGRGRYRIADAADPLPQPEHLLCGPRHRAGRHGPGRGMSKLGVRSAHVPRR